MIPVGYISSPSSNGFHVGPLFVHAYGLAYVFAVAAAILVARWGWKREGGDPDLPQETALWGFPAGLIGGRLYFIITTPSQIPPHWWGPFAIWKGGLGIWGGIAGGVVVGAWYLRRRGLTRQQMWRFADLTAPGLLVAQSIGRIGNYFNQELFGKPTTLPWGLRIDPAHRPPGYTRYATFQPTFLYEIIWNLALAAFLIWLGQRRRPARPGEPTPGPRADGTVPVIRPPGILALYMAGYSAFRIFEETIRIDYSNHILGMRLNFWIATILFLIGVVWFVASQRGWRLPGPWRRPQLASQRRT